MVLAFKRYFRNIHMIEINRIERDVIFKDCILEPRTRLMRRAMTHRLGGATAISSYLTHKNRKLVINRNGSVGLISY